MVDDNESYFTNKRNSIKIKPFLGNTEDGKLKKLKYVLEEIKNFDDVREGIKKFKKLISCLISN